MTRWDIAGTDNRLLDQYRESEKLQALLKSLLDAPSEDVRAAMESLYGRLAIATSEGIQLDRIGAIVGAPRPRALKSEPTELTTEDGLTVSSEDGETIMAEGVPPDAPMGDESYRLFLRAIIFQNTRGSSIPELERFGELLLQVPVSILDALGTIDLQFYGPLNDAEQEILLEVFKVAAGIRARYFTYAGGEGGFGFDGGPNTGFNADGAGFARLFEGQ